MDWPEGLSPEVVAQLDVLVEEQTRARQRKALVEQQLVRLQLQIAALQVNVDREREAKIDALLEYAELAAAQRAAA